MTSSPPSGVTEKSTSAAPAPSHSRDAPPRITSKPKMSKPRMSRTSRLGRSPKWTLANRGATSTTTRLGGSRRSGCRCRTAARCRRRRGLAARRGGRGRAGACRRPRRAGSRSSARGAGRRGRGPPRSGCRCRTAARCRRRRGLAALAEADADVRGDVDDVAAWPLAEADADALGDVQGREGPEADRALVSQPPRTGSSSKRMSLANRGAMSTTSRLGGSC